MFKVITVIGRVLSPIVVGLFELEWIYSFPVKYQFIHIIEILVIFPGALALLMMILYKICGIREEKIAYKLRYKEPNIKWIKVKLIVLEIITISLALIGLKYFNYPFSGKKEFIILFSILEMLSIILFLMHKKNIFIYEHRNDKIAKVNETADTTFYEIEYRDTTEDVKKLVERFAQKYGYGLDTDGDGLYYSYFDFDTACKVCFSYGFDDNKHVKIMCWITYCGEDYNLHHKFFRERTVNAFLSKEIKKIDELVSSINRFHWV